MLINSNASSNCIPNNYDSTMLEYLLYSFFVIAGSRKSILKWNFNIFKLNLTVLNNSKRIFILNFFRFQTLRFDINYHPDYITSRFFSFKSTIN